MPVLISESEDLQHSFSRDLHEAFWRLEALTLSPTLSQDNLRATFSRASLMHVDAPRRFIPMHDFQHIAQHWALQVWTTWSVSRTLFGSRKETFLTLNYFELIWCWFVMYWPERYSHTTLMQLRGGDTEAEGLKWTGHQVLCATKDATKGLSWKIQVHGTSTFIWRFKETHVFFVLGITWKDSFWHLQWITWGAAFGSSSIVGSALGPLLWRRETQPDMGRTAMWICPTGQGMVDDGRWHFWRSSCS